MYKIIITSDSNKHFEYAIKEYEKRLGKNVEIIKLKPLKNGTVDQIIKKETSNLLDKLSKIKGYKIVLNPFGKNLDTKELYSIVEKKKLNYSDIVFIIGGANGINYNALKSNIDFELNLGKMTMPHSLALLVIIEQIYRLEMIKKGTNYDK